MAHLPKETRYEFCTEYESLGHAVTELVLKKFSDGELPVKTTERQKFIENILGVVKLPNHFEDELGDVVCSNYREQCKHFHKSCFKINSEYETRKEFWERVIKNFTNYKYESCTVCQHPFRYAVDNLKIMTNSGISIQHFDIEDLLAAPFSTKGYNATPQKNFLNSIIRIPSGDEQNRPNFERMLLTRLLYHEEETMFIVHNIIEEMEQPGWGNSVTIPRICVLVGDFIIENGKNIKDAKLSVCCGNFEFPFVENYDGSFRCLTYPNLLPLDRFISEDIRLIINPREHNGKPVFIKYNMYDSGNNVRDSFIEYDTLSFKWDGKTYYTSRNRLFT